MLRARDAASSRRRLRSVALLPPDQPAGGCEKPVSAKARLADIVTARMAAAKLRLTRMSRPRFRGRGQHREVRLGARHGDVEATLAVRAQLLDGQLQVRVDARILALDG